MCIHSSLKNVPKPHVIFKCTETKSGKDWDAAEQALWGPDVVVDFHPTAYVDTDTNLMGLQEVMKPVNSGLAELGLKGVYFEDNYTAHKTERVAEYWSTELSQFKSPYYFPPNLTMSLQPIDAGIGLLYKNKVYEVLRNEIYRRERDAIKENRQIQKLSAKQKRILVTKAVGMVHREMLKLCLDIEARGDDMMSFPFYRSFVKTGTYVPIAHLASTPTPPSYKSMTNLISVQHFEHIRYDDYLNKEELKHWQEEHII